MSHLASTSHLHVAPHPLIWLAIFVKKKKRNQGAVYWVKVSRAQDQGLQFWQTKSHAIIVLSLVPSECIYRVRSQNGYRILLDRLSTPRFVPKVARKSNWQSQQQQQQSIYDDVSTNTRKLVRSAEPPVDKKPQFEIDVRKEGVSQDAILQDEAKMSEINEKLEK